MKPSNRSRAYGQRLSSSYATKRKTTLRQRSQPLSVSSLDLRRNARVFLAIDLGAGGGAKMAIYDCHRQIQQQDFLPRRAYGENAVALAAGLAKMGRRLAKGKAIAGVGISSPGLFRRDGSYLLAANLSFLNDCNLPKLISAELGVPAKIENDANAGALAEWSVLQCELLYWVLGGGWGGAWISSQGEVRFPALDWNGDDRTLHYSNEPGYAIPLAKRCLRRLFRAHEIDWDLFISELRREQPGDSALRGPGGDDSSLRAETVVSGTGRWRLFQAASAGHSGYLRYLDRKGQRAIRDPAVAGPYINSLSRLGVDCAVRTDRLFGAVLAESASLLLQQARSQGCPAGIPIAVGGKPAKALPYFGPIAQQILAARGYEGYMRPSLIDERGGNANLLGACVIAERAAEQR